MQILKINGKTRQFPQGLPRTLSELLGQLGIEAATVVAELDGRIVARESFAETALSEGQKIELVRFVPGG